MDALPEIFNQVYNDAVAVQQFIHLQDVNLLLHYASKLRDHLHFFENRRSHCVHLPCHATLVALIDEISELLESANRFLNTALPFTSNVINIETVPTTGPGRPKFSADPQVISALKSAGFSWSKIAQLLAISSRTLKRMRTENNCPEFAGSPITDDELDHLILRIKSDHPAAGYVYVWSAVKSLGHRVTFHRLKERMRVVDAPGIHTRLRRRLVRRKYRVKGANYLWHIDGNEKLVPWRFYIHGCVDGCSRRIIYLGLAHDKKAASVLQFFVQGVRENGLPVRVRADAGTENYGVRDYIQAARDETNNPFIIGRSIHNIRIERMWREVNRVVSKKFRTIFSDLQRSTFLDQNSVLDLLCLSYVYFPRINRSLQNFKELWNNHPLRTESSRSPNQLWIVSMIQQIQNETYSWQDSVHSEIGANNDIDVNDFPVSTASCTTFLPNEIELHRQFNNIAPVTIPDPLVDDGNDGMALYQTLRERCLSTE